jgi:hypothetical protein
MLKRAAFYAGYVAMAALGLAYAGCCWLFVLSLVARDGAL